MLLDLQPGDALGPFQLGNTLFNVLNLLQNYRHAYPAVKVAWDEDHPSTAPLHLVLSTPPLALQFDPLSQRLSRIEVHESPGDWVEYHGRSLREAAAEDGDGNGDGDGDGEGDDGDDDSDVVKAVRRVMGPTYSASTDGGEGEGILSYPGVAFGVVKLEAGGSKLSRIVITPLPVPASVPADTAWLHPTLPESPAIAEGDLRLVEIKLDELKRPTVVVVHFHISGSSTPPPPVILQLGTTTSEDLLCEFGSPVRSFWKEDDRLSIHTTSASAEPSLSPNPYFISHPHLGLTFLVHPTTHTLLKIILHSNLPGQVNFGRSSRCPFAFVPASSHPARPLGSSPPFADVAALLSTSSTPRSSSLSSEESVGERANGRTNGVKEHASVGADKERPMILDRTADGGDGSDVGKTTEIHGFPGIALEVTSSGDIETVWLF